MITNKRNLSIIISMCAIYFHLLKKRIINRIQVDSKAQKRLYERV